MRNRLAPRYTRPEDYLPPYCEWAEHEKERAQRIQTLQVDHWPKENRRHKVSFGTKPETFSIAKALKLGLVKPHPRYSDLVYRLKDDPEDEDVIIERFLS